MGFEQLASLKELLAKQAQQAKKAEAKPGVPEKADAQPAAARRADGKRPEARGDHKRSEARRPEARKPEARPVTARKRTEPVDPVVVTIGQLQKRFPKVFPKSPAPKFPLKLGIHKDLIAQSEQLGLTEPELLEAIKTWCRGTRYWASIVENAVRVDLAGEEAGRVLPAEAVRARSLESHRHRKNPAKKGAAGGKNAPAAVASLPVQAEQAAGGAGPEQEVVDVQTAAAGQQATAPEQATAAVQAAAEPTGAAAHPVAPEQAVAPE